MSLRISFLGAVACVFALFGHAQADDRDTIIESCGAGTNMPAAVCECIADRAPQELNDSSYSFFIAIITKDKAEQARLRGTTPPADLMEAAMFMTNAPADCAKQ